jgi:uroporphyrinogen-III synthase
VVPRIVLVTRPIEDFPATRDALAALGFVALACPCQRIVPRPPKTSPGAAQALLLTSRNAPRVLGAVPGWRALTAYCVGDATAAAARRAGWKDPVSAQGDARDLARLVRRRLAPRAGPLLLATAQGAGLPLVTMLRAEKFRVRRRVVYAVRPTTGLPRAALRAVESGQVQAVLFHAAGAAKIFSSAIRKAGLAESLRNVEAFTISKSAAAPLARVSGDHTWRRIQWPTRPTEAGMLAALSRSLVPAALVPAAPVAAALVPPATRPATPRPRQRPRT